MKNDPFRVFAYERTRDTVFFTIDEVEEVYYKNYSGPDSRSAASYNRWMVVANRFKVKARYQFRIHNYLLDCCKGHLF